MMERYKSVFSKELLRLMLVAGNKLNIEQSDEEMYAVFIQWLEKNKDFRAEISILNENQLDAFNKIIMEELKDVKDPVKAFYPFDAIKLKLKQYVLSEAYANSNKMRDKKDNSLKLSPMSFNDFLGLEDKKEYYIKNMFAKGTINMIFSPPASMKSFVSYYIGLCLATGNDFLNQKTKKVNVGYFDWENPLSDIQNRVKGICEGMNFKVSEIDNFYFFPKQPTLLKVTSYDAFVIEDLRDQLITFVKENNIKVLFFDTLRRLGNFDENDSGAINTIKSGLFDPLINECEVCIIFLHHTSKEGKNYRGSVDIEGILDTAFSVSKKPNEDSINLTLKNTKRRNNELELISALVEIENDEVEDEDGDMLNIINYVKFSKVADEEVQENSEYASYRTYFLENLILGEKYKNKDLIEMLKYNFGISSSKTTSKILKWLVEINILKSFGERKSKYYILNPVHANKEDESTLKELNKHFMQMFKENEIVQIDLLKSKFEDKFYSILVDDWISKGWLNNAKKGYLATTELFKAENVPQEIEVDMEDLN